MGRPLDKSAYVLMAGLPGTGKTTLANALAARLNGIVFNKDLVRAALFPAHLIDYTREQDDLCMGALLSAAEYISQRQSLFIFLDGRTFSREYQVEQVVQAATKNGCEWKILHLFSPDAVAKERLRSAEGREHVAGNRSFDLYRELKAKSEPVRRPRLEVDTSQDLQFCIELCRKYLVGD